MRSMLRPASWVRLTFAKSAFLPGDEAATALAKICRCTTATPVRLRTEDAKDGDIDRCVLIRLLCWRVDDIGDVHPKDLRVLPSTGIGGAPLGKKTDANEVLDSRDLFKPLGESTAGVPINRGCGASPRVGAEGWLRAVEEVGDFDPLERPIDSLVGLGNSSTSKVSTAILLSAGGSSKVYDASRFIEASRSAQKQKLPTPGQADFFFFGN
mmetsp:Transcript_5535/g.13603  ORF Transcript_5535/g.13603 Transcript_5535/m.13603 type:complete len:211 (+) Transcript_5535:934-1566(+)